jgi:hypothetical protein
VIIRLVGCVGDADDRCACHCSMSEDTGGTVTVLFSRHDRLSLQRIVGTARADRLITSDKNTFMFN